MPNIIYKLQFTTLSVRFLENHFFTSTNSYYWEPGCGQ